MAAITVNQELFEQLKQAYSEKFGRSPSLLITELNRIYHQKSDHSENLISLRTLRNFFNGDQPIKMQEKNLNYLCRVLLSYESYQEALRQQASLETPNSVEFSSSVEWLNGYQEYLKRRCGVMKVLSMSQPMPLDSIYTKVNVLESIKGRKPKTIEELLASLYDKNIRFNGSNRKVIDRGIEALKAVNRYSKLLIWGSPGAGKTTFLKHLAMYFSQEFPEKVIPVFISLRALADKKDETELNDEIIQEFATCIDNPKLLAQDLLEQGKLLILLDGLDEIKDSASPRIYQIIDTFLERYPKNRVVMTCRSGASEYVFKDFTEVEMANFDEMQIAAFVDKWFNVRQEPKLVKNFLAKLEENQSVKELAVNPLLLTMLCLVFEDNYDFPKNKYLLHEEATDILLRRWDASRRIERSSIYKGDLPRQRKINMLGKIAFDAFNQKPQKYFWRHWELEELIRDFIQNILGVNPDTLELDSRAILKTIESNHGLLVEQAKEVYSFSHLTFQEFFTAQYIVESRNPEIMLKVIEQHLIDRQWREVFLMIAGRLANADDFLKIMFGKINSIVKSKALQKMLNWLDEATTFHGVPSSSWRAFYLTTDHEVCFYTSRETKSNFTQNQKALAQKLAFKLKEINHEENKILPRSGVTEFVIHLVDMHHLAYNRGFKPQEVSEFIKEKLPLRDDFNIASQLKDEIATAGQVSMMLKEQLTNPKDSGNDSKIKGSISIREQGLISSARNLNYDDLADELIFLKERLPSNTAPKQDWQQWVEELQALMMLYLDVGYNEKLSKEDAKALEDYLYANVLLIECIRGDSYSSKHLRNQVIDNLLLPIKRIPLEVLPKSYA